MPESIADFPPQEIKGTRGYLVMRVCEDNDGLFVHGCVYDGNPQPLQTPEGVLEAKTTAAVRAWAVDYAHEFLPDRCIECTDGVLLNQEYGFADLPEGWTPVQRCDTCDQYDSDELAARAAAGMYNAKYAYFPAHPDLDSDEPGDWAVSTILVADPNINDEEDT